MSLADCAEVRVNVAMRPPSGNLVNCAHVSNGSSHLLRLATECGDSAFRCFTLAPHHTLGLQRTQANFISRSMPHSRIFRSDSYEETRLSEV